MADKKFYTIEIVAPDLVRGKFGPESADNDAIVRQLDAELKNLVEAEKIGGPVVLKFDGAASIQVASVLTHRLGHVVKALALRDPKMFLEDPEGLDFTVAAGTKFERKLKVRGRLVNSQVVPDPVFVVTVAHGASGLNPGDVIT